MRSSASKKIKISDSQTSSQAITSMNSSHEDFSEEDSEESENFDQFDIDFHTALGEISQFFNVSFRVSSISSRKKSSEAT